MLSDQDHKVKGKVKMKKINESEQVMFDRKVVNYELEKVSTTPSRSELQKEIAKKEKVKPEMVVVEKITNKYGGLGFEIEAKIYANKDSYKQLVPESMAKKSEIKEEPKEEVKTEEPENNSSEETSKEESAEAEKAEEEKPKEE